MLKTIVASAGALVLGIVGMLGVTNLLHNQSEMTTRVYGDWRLNCPPLNAKNTACTLTQDVVQNGGQTLVHIEIAEPENGKRIAVVVPHGVLLQPGLGLGVGTAPVRILKYQTCDQLGCVVVEPLGDDLLVALEDGDSGRVVVVSRNGQEVAFPYSLKGFRGGMRMLAWETYKRGSWFGRQLP